MRKRVPGGGAPSFPLAQQAQGALEYAFRVPAATRRWTAAQQANEVTVHKVATKTTLMFLGCLAAIVTGCGGPDTPEELFADGMSQFERVRFELAGKRFRRLADRFPDSGLAGQARLMQGLAIAYDRNKPKPAKAIELFRELEASDPSMAPQAALAAAHCIAHSYFGVHYEDRGPMPDFAAGREAYEHVVAAYPETPQAREAEYHAAQTLEMATFDPDYAEAARRYNAILTRDPESVWANMASFRLARIYDDFDPDPEKAIHYFRIHLDTRDPDDQERVLRCMFRIGALYMDQLGDRARARTWFERMHREYPRSIWSNRVLNRLETLDGLEAGEGRPDAEG